MTDDQGTLLACVISAAMFIALLWLSA